MTRTGERIPIGYTIWPGGSKPLAWRVPGAWTDLFSYAALKETARIAERGKLDYYFVGDQYGADAGAQYRALNHVSRPEAFTTAAYVAGVTENLGVIATTNTTYADPYTTARLTAQLDHVSNGRALWNIVTGLNPRPALNYGRGQHWDNSRRYDWAEEFVVAVQQLWDSWDDDAVVADRDSGLLVDPDKVREINFKGEFFSVKGPLNIGRPPQGHVPILHAGTSERSREYAARFADARFIGQVSPEYYADIKSRLEKYGRSRESQLLLAGVTFLVGATKQEALEKQRQIEELSRVDFDPRVVAIDLSLGVRELPLDVPLTELEELAGENLSRIEPTDYTSRPSQNAARASNLADLVAEARADLGEDRLTLRDVYSYYLRRPGHRDAYVVGDAASVADWIEERFEAYAFDGITAFTPYLPSPLYNFVDLVIPELQRRGRFRREYEPGTIRDRWGLARPDNQFSGKRSSGA